MLTVWTSLTNLVFPPTCAGCGASADREGSAICWDCREHLSIITRPICSLCGIPVHGRVDHAFICQHCADRPPPFNRARAAVLYNALGRRLVTRYKYNHALWMERFLTDLVENCVRLHYADAAFDLICPVPLHPSKQRQRGYNQARLIAGRLSKRLALPLVSRDTVARIRKTETQTRLTARQRLSNVKGAFKVNRPDKVAGMRMLLVDDVMTTGATVGACCRALKQAGADEVDVVTIARGV